MNNLAIRITAILIHAGLNITIISFLTDYDISGSWAAVILFLVVLLVLLFFFISHIISLINFIKTKT